MVNSNVSRLDEAKFSVYMKALDSPEISIITAVLNGVATLERMILTVIPQLSSKVEFILIDGGSTDGTLEILQKYQNWFSYWVTEPDDGIYDAWNKGIAKSRGKFLSFIGADDQLEPNYISEYLAHLEKHKNFNIYFSKIRVLEGKPYVVGSRYNEKEIMTRMSIPHVGALHSREIFKLFGGYNHNYKIAGDYELLLRARRYLRFCFVNKILVNMGSTGVSNTKRLNVIAESHMAKIEHQTKAILLIYFDSAISYIRFFLSKIFL